MEIKQAELEALADKIAERTRAEFFTMFGFTDDEKGRESLKELGDMARIFKEFNTELRKKSISGVISAIGWLVKLAILGALAYAALKIGLIGK